MLNEDSKKVFLELYKAETEEEVLEILNKYDMNSLADWKLCKEYKYLNLLNLNNAEKALTQKITNSVDSVLIQKCYENGINPQNEDMTLTTLETINKLFDLKENDILTKSEELVQKMGDSIAIYATSENMATCRSLGKNPHINITIYDEGKGNSPYTLQNELCTQINKNDHLLYCGDCGFCLIISKQNVKIPKDFRNESDDTTDLWGWTLIKKVLKEDVKTADFIYFAPDGKVPSFSADFMPLKPEIIKGDAAKKYLNYTKSCSAAIPYSINTKCGTAVKLFNYSLKNKGPLVSHFKYELGRNILDTYLPIKLIDCRKNKFNNETIFRGLNKLIEDDNRNKQIPLVNDKFPIIETFKISYDQKEQDIKLTVYGFNNTKENAKSAKDILGTGEISPIRIVLENKFQKEYSKTYITDAKLDPIKNSILIIIEFININLELKKDLFNIDIEKQITKYLKEFLATNEVLKEFAKEKLSQGEVVKARKEYGQQVFEAFLN